MLYLTKSENGLQLHSPKIILLHKKEDLNPPLNFVLLLMQSELVLWLTGRPKDLSDPSEFINFFNCDLSRIYRRLVTSTMVQIPGNIADILKVCIGFMQRNIMFKILKSFLF